MKYGSTLAERIVYAMDAQGVTQAELARMSGLSTGLVAQIVTGKTKDPRLQSVLAIAMALGVSLDYLAGNERYAIVRFGGDEDEG